MLRNLNNFCSAYLPPTAGDRYTSLLAIILILPRRLAGTPVESPWTLEGKIKAL